jgi:hypothetical protein
MFDRRENPLSMAELATENAKRVLVLGKEPSVLQGILGQLEALGIAAQGSIDGEHAADLFDARDFDLIAFGGALLGPVSERLRSEFAQQSPAVRFLDAYAPVTVKQIIWALEDDSTKQWYIADFRVIEDGSDLLVQGTILRPCTVRIDVYRMPDAPPPSMELVDRSEVSAGPFARRIDAWYRTYGHMLVMSLNEHEYCLYRMQIPH